MRNYALLSLLLLSAPASARRKSDAQPVVQKVPSIEEVVAKEGFVPTPSQSETYRPGVVLVPNAQGGHDVVHSDCIGVDPDISIMSQSSIATSLSAGVSARLSAVRGQIAGGIEKRLSFVDPEQRTIPFSALNPSEDCASGLETAARFTDLSKAILVYDVLVAQIQNTVCTKADASGRVMMLGEAEAAAYSECVQESDAQVSIGYKAVPLEQVLGAVKDATSSSFGDNSAVDATNAEGFEMATPSVEFGTSGADAAGSSLRSRRCELAATTTAARIRESRVQTARSRAAEDAGKSWQALSPELEACKSVPTTQRGPCIGAAELWLAEAASLTVSSPAGPERVETECGVVVKNLPAVSYTVEVPEVALAQRSLLELRGLVQRSPGEFWTGASGYEMVLLDGGHFVMGAASATSARSREEPRLVVLTRPIWIGRFEVTQALWREVMGANPSKEFAYSWAGLENLDNPFGIVEMTPKTSLIGDHLPVQNVRECDIFAFANLLSRRDGFEPVYAGVEACEQTKTRSIVWKRDANGYRVPTEAEWEYAAKAGTRAEYAGASTSAGVCAVGNVRDRSFAERFGDDGAGPTLFECNDGYPALAPVGSFESNRWGLYDMTGNVAEACWKVPTDREAGAVDPQSDEEYRWLEEKGGGWRSSPNGARVSLISRGGSTLDFQAEGVRLVRTHY